MADAARTLPLRRRRNRNVCNSSLNAIWRRTWPIIDDNPGRGEKREFSPAEAVRYRERSAVERVNSHLHEQHGGRHVHVRGPVKVAAHLTFGLVVIAAEQMLRMLV